jgi:murein peptide amidase A
MLLSMNSTPKSVPKWGPKVMLTSHVLAYVLLVVAALGVAGQAQASAHALGRHGGLPPDTAAKRLEQSICGDWSARIPKLSMGMCATSGLMPSQGRSVKGEPLYKVDVRAGSPQLRVMVVGGIHGDELTSTTVAMHWLQLARDNPSIAYWRFIPLLNPDGMLATPARRMNDNGVDLNRNFPTKNWTAETKQYWEKRTGRDPRRWPGPAAGSEPETQFLLSEIQAFQPDLIVSIHAPYGILDFDGALTPPAKLGRLHLDRLGIYPGSMGNYGSLEYHVPVVTVELLHAIDAPSPDEVQRMWADLLAWMQNRLLFERYSDLVEQGERLLND